MATVKLVCGKPFVRYGGKCLMPGDKFEASEEDAQRLKQTGQARDDVDAVKAK